MKIRNILKGKVVAAVVLLTALVCWGFQDNKPLVYGTIQEAAKNGDLADVKKHLARGTDVNVKDKYGETPLHWAIRYGHKDVAELLIAKGADVNVKGQVGRTPLHSAANAGSKDVAEVLIAKGADVHVKDEMGQTPLHEAAITGSKDVAEVLIAKGADVHVKDEMGQTPLHEAATAGSKDVAEVLIAKGADVNARDSGGGTPLHVAASFGHKDVAELLIAKGADVNAKQKDGRTPLFLADALDMAELLITKGADVNARDSDGDTPLSMAASAPHMDMVELLKKHGARANQSSGSLSSHPPEPELTKLLPHRLITGEEVAPKTVKPVDPIYPEDAMVAKVEGIVIIEATTDEQGKVIDAKILRSIPLLDEAALAAVKQSIYEPYIINGVPRGVIFTVSVRFTLRKKDPLPR